VSRVLAEDVNMFVDQPVPRLPFHHVPFPCLSQAPDLPCLHEARLTSLLWTRFGNVGVGVQSQEVEWQFLNILRLVNFKFGFDVTVALSFILVTSMDQPAAPGMHLCPSHFAFTACWPQPNLVLVPKAETSPGSEFTIVI
jgi:hypothetical protein